ncbi:MAG TPA: nitrite reductase small subunit NirD [Gammaproteobacteria bacterium]
MWLDAGPLDSIPRRGARVLRTTQADIALFRTADDAVYALLDRCPHRGGPLSQGLVHGRCVTCPLHDWVIDLATGEASEPDEGETATFEVRVHAGRVLVRAIDAAAFDGRGR